MNDIVKVNGEKPVSEFAPKPADEMAVLGGARLVEYCAMASTFIRQTNSELTSMIQDMVDQNEQLARDIDEMGRLQAERTRAVAERAKAAALGMRDIRDAFKQPLGV